MVAMASLTFSRSALPNFTPLTTQLASKRDFGLVGWTITPTKDSQPGARFLMASVIADSRLAEAIGLRLPLRMVDRAGATRTGSALGFLTCRIGDEGDDMISARVSMTVGDFGWPCREIEQPTTSYFNCWAFCMTRSISSEPLAVAFSAVARDLFAVYRGCARPASAARRSARTE
jgi:hypothetical protein